MKGFVTLLWIVSAVFSIGLILTSYLIGYNTGWEAHGDTCMCPVYSCDLQGQGQIDPLTDWGCDSPALRLWVYDHFENVKFKRDWNPQIQQWYYELMCTELGWEEKK